MAQGVEDPKRPFTRLDPYSYRQTLAQRLSGVRLVDPLRDLCNRFGIRHYVVAVVRLGWSGGQRGSGEPWVEEELIIEPVPRLVGGVEALDLPVTAVGTREVGQLVVDRISTRYEDHHLRGLFRGEERMPEDRESFWEVRFQGARGDERRRLALAKPPSRQTLGWVVHLDRAYGQDREPLSGNPPPARPLYEPL